MDFLNLLLQAGLITSCIVFYLIVFKKSPPKRGHYSVQGWNYPLKYLVARFALRKWKAKRPTPSPDETPRPGIDGWDNFLIRATAVDGTALLLGVRRIDQKRQLAEVTVYVQLPDGTVYRLPRHPDTAVGAWETTADGSWCAGGLKIQILEPKLRLRILYNGLLTRNSDDTPQHVQLNLLWISGSDFHNHPEDWSDQLAAQALAREPWRDGNWIKKLDKWNNGSWLQWGIVQGHFRSYDAAGAPYVGLWVRARGTKERSWAPRGYQGLRKQVDITAVASDGTMVQLRAQSYKDTLTHVVSGCIRFPDYEVRSIVSTDFALPDFCEHLFVTPDLYTLNVYASNGRSVKLIIRMNKDGGRLYSGAPYKHEVEYQTLTGCIDGFPASGLLEIGFEARESREPAVPLSPARQLKWKSASEVSFVKFCHDFEDDAAACPDFVGGKGASLALLASVQAKQGYKVPPGFCVTTLALQKHLASNPELKDAILEIEAANEDYNETVFKEKCEKASSLFASTEVVDAVKEEVLSHLHQLTLKATEQGLGPDVRFAVRSSAVGEDGEVLSAAGQNDTILGCAGAAAVLGALARCWGSVFAFTSAHYRRQNGQACMCGAGVVVQAMARPDAAGVLFTRHPLHGDPARLLLTANYGLGESVVSGSVEPDTIVVSRKDNDFTISNIELGSKKHRVAALASGDVATEPVPETDRNVLCLSETEVLRLARIAASQEELWGAPRDIEWAVCESTIYLLQARPITSLERWTEEELLHEMDSPIMSDHSLTTFANTGEVMPKPVCPLNKDLVVNQVSACINKLFSGGDSWHNFRDTTGLTHCRAYLDCYNSLYRRVGPKIDLVMRLSEMGLFGHTVADDNIHGMATHVNPPRMFDGLRQGILFLKSLITSRSYMTAAKKRAKTLTFETLSEEPRELAETLQRTEGEMRYFHHCHMVTSTSSSASQVLAMMVLLENSEDITAEKCSEIGKLLNTGGTVSAEVPQALDRLARGIIASGQAEEFRAVEPTRGLAWLADRLPAVHDDIQHFLREHGFRALCEFDLATTPWALAPEQLIEALQNMRVVKELTHSVVTDSELIASLTTPKKNLTRRILSWVLPMSRRMVVYRESTKASLVLSVHSVRLLARRLARAMTRRWLLPEPDLVFYFRLHELLDYVRTRDPALLRKAQQRHQLYPKWGKLKFAELNTGWPLPHPHPHPAASPRLTPAGRGLLATPVCAGAGDVVARAAVINDLSQIGELKQGDILITHSTDIGWSPYFPLLSGIVTELGGLISHGAVIAREYGLPCIVGAAGATEQFVTGDLVRLSGVTGVVEKVTQEPSAD